MAFNPAIAGIGVVGASAVVGGGLSIGGALSEGPIEDVSSIRKSPEFTANLKDPNNWHSVFYDNDYDEQIKTGGYYDSSKNIYGYKYRRTLAGVNIKKGSGGRLKIEWWTWNYRYMYNPDKATGGFSREKVFSWKTLNEACKKAYKGTLNETKEIVEYNGEEFKEEDIWSFCSPARRKPTTFSNNDNYTARTIGAEGGSSKLVSTKDKSNTKFWSTRTIFFRIQAHPSAEKEKFFEKLRIDMDSNKNNDELALMKRCEEAYSQQAVATSTDENKPTKAEVEKYCSLNENVW